MEARKKEWRYLRPPHHAVEKPKVQRREEDDHDGNGEGHLYPNQQTHDREDHDSHSVEDHMPME